MSGDQLDLDTIEAQAADYRHILETARCYDDARIEPRAYPDNAIECGGMVHYVDDDHKTHHPDVTCSCSPTPVRMPRP